MQKEAWTWSSEYLSEPARLARWGHFGTPVLLFPGAGGDFEEVERFHLIRALEPLVAAGRMKVYSVDGLAMRTWLRATLAPEECARRQLLYDAFLYEEVVPRVRRDCQSASLELVAAGVSFGAFYATTVLSLHPDVFRAAVGISGNYDLSAFLRGVPSSDFQRSSPLHFLPGLIEGPRLQQLRRRTFILETGEGDLERPDPSRQLAAVLVARAIPHSLRLRGATRHHDWSSWRELLPACLAELT